MLIRSTDGRGAIALSPPDELEVTGLEASEIGELAHAHGVPLHHLAELEQSLEQAYLSLTAESVDYHGVAP